jgi:hypothetical protein
LTAILHFAPSRLSGFNVCPMATLACIKACLNTAGRGGIFKKGETTNKIQAARLRKTLFYFNETDKFMAQLAKEIGNIEKLARKHGLKPAIRLNGTSDIRWENEKAGEFVNLMEMFPNVMFYDYTKIPNRRNLPANYHLTFSLSESNDAVAQTVSQNVAVVFRKVPPTFMGRPVVDGDLSDLRFLDPKGVIVGLKAKGKAKQDSTGFVRN